MIIIIDFGSQTCHLIGRRLHEMGTKAEIVVPEEAVQKAKELKPTGIIFSGGPSSVYEPNAPIVDKEIFNLGLPILGICYGQQLISHLLDGDVKPGKTKEYGPAQLTITKHDLFKNIPQSTFQVWMSHGDEVIAPPPGFEIIASTDTVKAGSIANTERKIYAVQFHPEVQHTTHGLEILKNFLNICGEEPQINEIDIDAIIADIKEKVGDKKVVMAFSGGTDSAIAGTLIARAIGQNLIPVYIESGLMRPATLQRIETVFPTILGVKPIVIHAQDIFLERLKGVTDPEQKRKTIGALYVELFEKEAEKHSNVAFLGQGTTYADFIHSKSTKHAALIKSHHNVGGLPKDMKYTLLEPIRYFYTDQVRYIGTKLGLPTDVVKQQPFPGPGFAVRILGEVNKARLEKEIQADSIVVEEIEKAGLKDEIFQYWAIMTGTNTTAIKGDGRFYGEVVAIRAFTTEDRMTADWAKIPYPVLQKISTRIVNEVQEISRVVYDITTKPPATMEWE
ncbi:MAG: synthase [Candidatus Parcubacteria bacterium]|jgi:GMP synthase (glutamine-hydrolysing)